MQYSNCPIAEVKQKTGSNPRNGAGGDEKKKSPLPIKKEYLFPLFLLKTKISSRSACTCVLETIEKKSCLTSVPHENRTNLPDGGDTMLLRNENKRKEKKMREKTRASLLFTKSFQRSRKRSAAVRSTREGSTRSELFSIEFLSSTGRPLRTEYVTRIEHRWLSMYRETSIRCKHTNCRYRIRPLYSFPLASSTFLHTAIVHTVLCPLVLYFCFFFAAKRTSRPPFYFVVRRFSHFSRN